MTSSFSSERYCDVRVVCRFRPVTEVESKRTCISDTEEGEPCFEFPSESTVQALRGSASNKSDESFTFDRVFSGTTVTQKEVYEYAAKETVEDVLKGYNGTIFAYGQTGAGKSFTMFGPTLGDPELRGIIPRACTHLFTHIARDRSSGTEYTIKCSFLEIYKERVRDLLNPKNANLKVRETPSRGVWVDNLTEEFVHSEEEVLELLGFGERFRSVAATEINALSSRSHSLFTLTLHQKLRDGSTKTGKLNLADLAGSEKVSKSGASGETLEEAKKINQSLSALGNCISALSKLPKGANPPSQAAATSKHIPYRDSKLTFILRESLGGNSKTTLVCACSPHSSNLEETVSTLRFGQRAKQIKNTVQVNQQRSAEELSAIIAQLRKEVAMLRRQVASLQAELKKYKSDGTNNTSNIDTTNGARSNATPSAASSPFRFSLSRKNSTKTAISPRRSQVPAASDKEAKLNEVEEEREDDTESTSYYDPVAAAEAVLELERLRESSNLRIEELMDELKVLESTEKEQSTKIERMKEELHLKDEIIARTTSEASNAEANFLQQLNKADYAAKQLQYDMEQQAQEIKALSEYNALLKTRAEEEANKATAMQTENQALLLSQEHLLRKNKLAEERVQVCQASLEELQNQVKNLMGGLETLQQKKRQAQKERDEALHMLETIKQEKNGLELLLQSQRLAHAEQHFSVDEQVKRLEHEMEKLVQQNQQLAADAQQAKLDNQQLRSLLKESEAKQTSERNSLSRQLSDAQNAIEKEQQRSQRAEIALEEKEIEAREALLRASSLASDLEERDMLYEQLRVEKDSLLATHKKKDEEKDRRLTEMEQEMNRMKQEMQKQQQKMEEERANHLAREKLLKEKLALFEDAENRAMRVRVVAPVRPNIVASVFKRRQSLTAGAGAGFTIEKERARLSMVVSKEGWLTKEGGLVRNWKQRWFVLQGLSLLYFEAPSKEKPKGSIPLDGCYLGVVENVTSKKHSFAIYHDSRRTFILQAASAEEMTAWMAAIDSVILSTSSSASTTTTT
ncbi:Kinesin-like protein unc-104 [Balamuthia mandrillaris]